MVGSVPKAPLNLIVNTNCKCNSTQAPNQIVYLVLTGREVQGHALPATHMHAHTNKQRPPLAHFSLLLSPTVRLPQLSCIWHALTQTFNAYRLVQE